MGEYALLTEVYGPSGIDGSEKVSGKKRKKNKKQMERLLNQPLKQPLSPNDMDRELLNDNEKTVFNKQTDPELRLKNMKVSPYINFNNDYQNVENYQNYRNENIMTPENQYVSRNLDMNKFNDPEYEEFLEYKKMKRFNNNNNNNNFLENMFKTNIFESNDQFNELLLYIFTGVFLLMIYDNIYKLGKNSY